MIVPAGDLSEPVKPLRKKKGAVGLYGYQERWLADDSRFKIGLMCRQIGKSFAVSLEAVLDAIETGNDWVLLSAGERQSKELMAKVNAHLKACGMAAESMEIDYFEDTKLTMLTAWLPNGARIIGLPANPDTARGFTANVILDEFAFHKDSDAIWRAMFPTVSKGYKVRVVSTPQGKGNKFASLWNNDNGWSKHFVDIYQAVKDGVEHNIDELKKGIDDADAWQQEFECLFIDDASAWLTYDLIEHCYDIQLPHEIEYEDFDIDLYNFTPHGPLYAGYDVGRVRDRAVLWVMEQIGDVFWTRLILTLPKVKYKDQKAVIFQVMKKWNIERICIDSTGLGDNLAEDVVDFLGESRAEGVKFTNPSKQDLAGRMKRKFEDRLVRIPNDRVLRDDLHSVKKLVTAANNVRFDAERTKDGHADRFWAGALALMASDCGCEVELLMCG